MSFRSKFLDFERILFSWFFEDIIFVIIPLLVIASLTAFLDNNFTGFFLLKEWSFASIVFFGVAIRRLIRLKVRLQLVPYSYKLDTGVQLFIVLLIASVLVLSLVILVEKNIIQNLAIDHLAKVQLSLFCLGAFSILMAVIAENREYGWVTHYTRAISKAWYLKRIDNRVDLAEDVLSEVFRAIEIIPSLNFSIPDKNGTRFEEEKLCGKINWSIERLITLSAELKTKFQSCDNEVRWF